ncbi:hypothetical protein [Wufeng Chodsigoa smithii henipavirus 1]|nr:hypothetical protein [Wufeng Chodsigoa smithii henipavirus 1]
MPSCIYESPNSDYSRVSHRCRTRSIDYKCLFIISLLVILTITIILSFMVFWYNTLRNQAGVITYHNSRATEDQGRERQDSIPPTRRTSIPNFRPGIPGQRDCESRAVPYHQK